MDIHFAGGVFHFAVLNLNRAREGLRLGGRLPAVLLLEGERASEESSIDKRVQQDFDQIGAFALFLFLLLEIPGDAAGQVRGLALDSVDEDLLALRFEIIPAAYRLRTNIRDVMSTVGQNPRPILVGIAVGVAHLDVVEEHELAGAKLG